MSRLALAALATAALLAACAPMPPAPPTPSAPATAAAARSRIRRLGEAQRQARAPGHPADSDRASSQEVARYADFRGHGFVDWHPSRREMLVSHRKAGASTGQIHRLAAPMGELEQVTDFAEPVSQASYEPLTGDSIVFERSTGGNEASQIYRLDLASKQVTVITEPDMRHDLAGWLNLSSRLLYSSVPLDRTASGGRRAEIVQTLTLVDPANPDGRRKLAELPGSGWFPGGVSWDDRRLLLNRYYSANHSEVWLLDLASGERTRVLPAPGSTDKAVHLAGEWKRDNSGFFFISDRSGEFRELMFYSLVDGRITSITRHIKGDIEDSSLSHDGRLLAVRAKVEGRDEPAVLRHHRLQRAAVAGAPGRQRHRGALPSAPAGPRLRPERQQGPEPDRHAGAGRRRLAGVDPAVRAAGGRHVALRGAADRPLEELRRPRDHRHRRVPGGALPRQAPGADRHPRRPRGRREFGFLGRGNYYLEELGVAVIQPNVRGSAGFGKTFLSLDNGRKREDSVKDIGALLDWIATQPRLDPSRVVVTGGSYGGYMSLAVATTYPERIAGAIDVVGISNFVSFLENTESYRRDLRRVEYGDERDPEMRAFLTRISPLTHAAKITKPLFVVQGKNDPRVPYTEAEQIVREARASGATVWYLLAENEGHGFARKENADFLFYSVVMFMRETCCVRRPIGAHRIGAAGRAAPLMSPEAGLRPTSPPNTSLRSAPHRPDPSTAGRRAIAFALDGRTHRSPRASGGRRSEVKEEIRGAAADRGT